MAKRTVLRAAALVGALTVTLAACGSDDEGSTAGGESTAAGGSSGSPTSASEAPSGSDCDPPQAEPTGTPSTEPLIIGSILPETGDLAFLGPPEFAGIDLAVAEINEAGGVLGQPITHNRGDSGDTKTDTVNQTTDRLLAAGAQVIVGAASSGVSQLVIDKITDAGVVQFSPANTSDEFTCWEDEGLYFRTAPPDLLQAQALAELMASEGAQRVSLLARNDPYGTGLADNTQQNLIDAGIPEDQIQQVIYDPNAASFNAEVDQIREFDADAIAVIGFDESKRILTRMGELQIGPGQRSVYGSDGNIGNSLGEGLPPGLLEGMKGTLPLTDLSPDFEQRLLAVDPALEDFNYAGESYDAVVLSACAAEAAQSTNGQDIAAELNGITQDGEKVTTFADCKRVIEAGGDVDYDGITGELSFTASGEPGSASFGIQTFNAENRIDDAATQFVVVGG